MMGRLILTLKSRPSSQARSRCSQRVCLVCCSASVLDSSAWCMLTLSFAEDRMHEIGTEHRGQLCADGLLRASSLTLQTVHPCKLGLFVHALVCSECTDRASHDGWDHLTIWSSHSHSITDMAEHLFVTHAQQQEFAVVRVSRPVLEEAMSASDPCFPFYKLYGLPQGCARRSPASDRL